jgi:hypothetical protein
MSWTGNPSHSGGENGRFAAAQAAQAEEQEAQNQRAARVVAGHSTGAEDCAEMLAMLGLAPERSQRLRAAAVSASVRPVEWQAERGMHPVEAGAGQPDRTRIPGTV